MTLTFVFDDLSKRPPENELKAPGLGPSPFVRWVASEAPYRSMFSFIDVATVKRGEPRKLTPIAIYPVGLAIYPKHMMELWSPEVVGEGTPFGNKIDELSKVDNLYILFDHSYESLMPEDMELLPEVLKRMRFPLHRIIVFSNHTRLQHMAVLSKEYGITILGAFFWEFYYHALCKPVLTTATSKLDQKLTAMISGVADVEKIYLCLNRRPRFHRIALGSFLYARDYMKDGFLSFGGMNLEWDPVRSANEAKFAERLLTAGLREPLDWEKAVKAFVALDAISLDRKFSTKPKSDELAEQTDEELIELHHRSLISIVTETNFGDNSLDHFITEKVMKPIAFGHPFIVVAPPGALEDLREAGYETFAPDFKEHYDLVCNPAVRFAAIARTIDELMAAMRDDPLRTMRPLLGRIRRNQENFVLGVPRRIGHVMQKAVVALQQNLTISYRTEVLADENTLQGELVEIGETYYRRVMMHQSPYVSFFRGFYPYESDHGGRWCSSIGVLRMYLGPGRWLMGLRFNKQASVTAPYIYVEGERVDPCWYEIESGEVCVFQLNVTSGYSEVRVYCRSIWIPNDEMRSEKDERRLGVWVFDDLYLRRLDIPPTRGE